MTPVRTQDEAARICARLRAAYAYRQRMGPTLEGMAAEIWELLLDEKTPTPVRLNLGAILIAYDPRTDWDEIRDAFSIRGDEDGHED